MVIIAVALVMTPAVYYRVVEPANISKGSIRRSSSLIRWALAPLACGLGAGYVHGDYHGNQEPECQHRRRDRNALVPERVVVRVSVASAQEAAAQGIKGEPTS